MAITKDDIFLVTSALDGSAKMINTEKGEVVKDFKQIHFSSIEAVTFINDQLFSVDSQGNMKKMLIEFDNNPKSPVDLLDFGQIHDNCIYSIYVTDDQKYLYTCDHNGFMKLWDTTSVKNQCIQDFGRICLKNVMCITA